MKLNFGDRITHEESSREWFVTQDCDLDMVVAVPIIRTDFGRSTMLYDFNAESVEVVLERDPEFLSKVKYRVGNEVIISLDHPRLPGNTVTITSIGCQYGDVYYYTTKDGYGDYYISANDIWCLASEMPDYVEPPMKIFRCCDRCGAEFAVEDDVDGVDECLCEECRERNFITPYHRYEPKLRFFGDAKDGLYFGTEIEVDKGGEYHEQAAMAKTLLNGDDYMFSYCSHDGSLHNGFEIITMPATLEYHQSKISDYRDAFKYLVSRGYRGHDSDTAGIHVHFSREYYSDNEEENVSKLLYLVERFWDEIIVFSRRDYQKSKEYMKKMDAAADTFYSCWNRSQDHDGHYYAVNISNPNTIELRMFRSTLNIDTYMATLEFADKLVRTAKEKTVAELQAISFSDLLTKNAAKYYQTRVSAKEFDEV